MKVVRLSALHTCRVYPPGNIPGTHFCYRLSRTQGHSATDRIMPMKKSTDTIGNRTRDLPVCSVTCATAAAKRGLARWEKKRNGDKGVRVRFVEVTNEAISLLPYLRQKGRTSRLHCACPRVCACSQLLNPLTDLNETNGAILAFHTVISYNQ
jgi:hypothetical protein